MPKQPGHRMRDPVLVGQALPQNHEAAAFTMDGTGIGELPQTRQKTRGPGQSPGMKLGIAARQPAAIGGIGWGCVSQRRKGQDLCPGGAPACQLMRIEKAERRVLRQRDALAGGRQGWPCGQRSLIPGRVRGGGGADRVKVQMAFGEGRKPGQPVSQAGTFKGLHKAQMPFGQGDIAVFGQGAKHRNPGLGHARPGQRLMPG